MEVGGKREFQSSLALSQTTLKLSGNHFIISHGLVGEESIWQWLGEMVLAQAARSRSWNRRAGVSPFLSMWSQGLSRPF